MIYVVCLDIYELEEFWKESFIYVDKKILVLITL